MLSWERRRRTTGKPSLMRCNTAVRVRTRPSEPGAQGLRPFGTPCPRHVRVAVASTLPVPSTVQPRTRDGGGSTSVVSAVDGQGLAGRHHGERAFVQVVAKHRGRGALPPRPSSQASTEKADYGAFNAAHTGAYGSQRPDQIVEIRGFLTRLACEGADAAGYGSASSDMATIGDSDVAAPQRTERRQTGFASSDLLAEACGGCRTLLVRTLVARTAAGGAGFAAVRQAVSPPLEVAVIGFIALPATRQCSTSCSRTIRPRPVAADLGRIPGGHRTERWPHCHPAAPSTGVTRKGGIVQQPHKQHGQSIQQVNCWPLCLC